MISHVDDVMSKETKKKIKGNKNERNVKGKVQPEGKDSGNEASG